MFKMRRNLINNLTEVVCIIKKKHVITPYSTTSTHLVPLPAPNIICTPTLAKGYLASLSQLQTNSNLNALVTSHTNMIVALETAYGQNTSSHCSTTPPSRQALAYTRSGSSLPNSSCSSIGHLFVFFPQSHCLLEKKPCGVGWYCPDSPSH